ncbi:aspartyl-tRNA synthetase AspS [Clostridium aceticum]|uniref:Aspartate--tRNA ligase n=1 Tax=Clostridium aceticum TaxID=84022 RepID=A0A0D8I8G3_9CLOT|nr:aspartate--tRNA(Asn) ligase [Clostridium aceticum]AKL95863.1 aspartyl-tRNA synthetase AspS [Clostridium aceticum]KJF26548.1 aspartyl-tRNA synthetase [Clostridium aceticum]
MKRSFITEIKGEEEAVLLKGWIFKVKKFKTFGFVSLRDKTGILQLVLEDLDVLESLKTEMAVEVIGTPVKNEKVEGGIEIHIKDLTIIGNAYYDLLPFSINQKNVNTSLEMELDHRYISLRRPDRRAIFKVQEEIVTAFRDYFKDQGFSEIHTPKIIASGTEGGSEVFTVNYFDRRAFLAQSPQFYKQMMVGAGFESVFEIGHAYRAELHNTWRHLNEYVSLDVETGFIKDEEDLMNIQQQFIQHLFQHLTSACEKELKIHNITLPEIKDIPRIPLFEAQKILLEVYDKKSPVGNLDAEGEIVFSKYVKEKYDSDFVFLTKYPAIKRPMYTMPDEDYEGMTKSFDLIYKGLEITTGGQRIHDYEMLKENIIKFGSNPEDFGFYVESFKYGMPPHGGFAMGLERLTMKILDLQNIRESTLLPRDMGRITP